MPKISKKTKNVGGGAGELPSPKHVSCTDFADARILLKHCCVGRERPQIGQQHWRQGNGTDVAARGKCTQIVRAISLRHFLIPRGWGRESEQYSPRDQQHKEGAGTEGNWSNIHYKGHKAYSQTTQTLFPKFTKI